MPGPLIAIDLCAGVGGWACACLGLRIVIREAIDLDKAALATYAHNFPAVKTTCRDVAELVDDAAWLAANGDVDLILGGIPCEAISKRRRSSANRATPAEVAERVHKPLDACLRIVKLLEPTFWCLEDVVEVVGHLPPLTPYELIDSAKFSAQSRKRAYVGIFPSPRPHGGGGVLGDHLRRGPYRLGGRVVPRTPKRSSNHTAHNHSWWAPERPSHTVCAMSSRRDIETVVVSPLGNRRQLEWQEAASIQGFPSWYTFIGSPTQVGKHVGQAIQVDTGRAILGAVAQAWASYV
jgi:site-specific DNA-cytosine methylase